MSFTLQQKFIGLTAAAIVATLGNAALTKWSDDKATAFNERQATIVQVMHRNMEGDMQDDNMWGDIMSVLYAAKTGADDIRRERTAKVAEHYKVFVDDVKANQAVPNLPSDIKTQLKILESSVQEYGSLAQSLLKSADDNEAVTALLAKFTLAFKQLQVDEDKASELITRWSANADAEEKEFNSHIILCKMVLLLGNIVLASIVAVFAIAGIFKPLRQMMEAMHHIAEGNTETAIPYRERRDEIGDMARTVEIFKENALRVIQMADTQARQKELSEVQKREAMQAMAGNFETNVKNVVDMVASAATQMDATSKSVASIAENNQDKLGLLTTQLEGTTRNVSLVASATSQLSAAINEINKQVTLSTSITSMAVAEAQKADNTVQGLTDAAQKIGEVVEMINSIAAQINLLALNATIEAARAGDAGKGFAVVASEVKSLATQTTKATEQIAQYITSIQDATGETVSAIKVIGGKIREINEISTTIASAVEEQGIATQDIANNVQQAAHGTEEVSRNATDVSATSKETGESANQMMAATSELSRQSEVLRREVDKFLDGVRHG